MKEYNIEVRRATNEL